VGEEVGKSGLFETAGKFVMIKIMDKGKFLLMILMIGSLVSFLAGCLPKKGQPEISSGEAIQKGGEMEIPKTKNQKLKILMVVAPKDFRDEEYQEPRQILEQAGAEITVAAKGVSEATGMFGAKITVDKDLSEVSAVDYDAVVFIGGSGASVYFEDQTALNLAEETYDSGKVVGAICIAPSILANAGILEGKKTTAFSSEAGNLQAKGAIYIGEPVTVDGRIITASGPQAAGEFGEAIIKILGV